MSHHPDDDTTDPMELLIVGLCVVVVLYACLVLH